MREKIKFYLDEYGRVIINDNEILAEVYGSLSPFLDKDTHDANCKNIFCGHVIACVNTSCSEKK